MYGSRMTRAGDMLRIAQGRQLLRYGFFRFWESAVRSYSIESIRSRSVRTLQRWVLAICA